LFVTFINVRLDNDNNDKILCSNYII